MDFVQNTCRIDFHIFLNADIVIFNTRYREAWNPSLIAKN